VAPKELQNSCQKGMDKKILTAHQPSYLPWLGLFHKIALSDMFCYFDIVQYQRKDFNNRNKINTANGPIWLSVPVNSSNRFLTKINDIHILDNNWRENHLKSILLNYKKTPFFDDYFPEIEKIISKRFEKLTDLNFEILLFGLKSFNIETNIVKASDFNFIGIKSELVLDMCKKLNCDLYIFGEQGKSYADVDSFVSNKIIPYFQKYESPIYSQKNKTFHPKMSFIDLLFNHGPNSLDILFEKNITRNELEKKLLDE